MLKTFSCADLFSRPLCWSIYWWIMCLLYGLEYIAKNHHIIYRDSDWNLCWQSGKFMKSQGIFFLPIMWQPWWYVIYEKEGFVVSMWRFVFPRWYLCVYISRHTYWYACLHIIVRIYIQINWNIGYDIQLTLTCLRSCHYIYSASLQLD